MILISLLILFFIFPGSSIIHILLLISKKLKKLIQKLLNVMRA